MKKQKNALRQFVSLWQFAAAEKTLQRLCRCKASAVLVVKNSGAVLAIKGTRDGETTLVFRGPGEEAQNREQTFKKPLRVCCKYMEKTIPSMLAWVQAPPLRVRIAEERRK